MRCIYFCRVRICREVFRGIDLVECKRSLRSSREYKNSYNMNDDIRLDRVPNKRKLQAIADN